MIREIKGNMFDYVTENDYIIHCISSDFALGAGIAKEIDKRYNVRSVLLNNPVKKIYKPGDGYVIVTGKVLNLVTKEKYYNKPTYGSLLSALEKLLGILKTRNITKIHMPRIGCGLDKLRWDMVFPIICRVFMNSGIDVYIYYL